MNWQALSYAEEAAARDAQLVAAGNVVAREPGKPRAVFLLEGNHEDVRIETAGGVHQWATEMRQDSEDGKTFYAWCRYTPYNPDGFLSAWTPWYSYTTELGKDEVVAALTDAAALRIVADKMLVAFSEERKAGTLEKVDAGYDGSYDD